MSHFCNPSLQLCAIRVTLLDDLGNISDEEDNSYVSDLAVSITNTPEIVVGAVVNLPGGCCPSIANGKQPDSQVRNNFAFVRGGLEWGLEALLLGSEVYVDGSDIIGASEPSPQSCGGLSRKVAFEFWTKNWDGDSQDQVWPWIHWTYPASSWAKGAATASAEFMQPTVNGFSIKNELWGNGPYGDQPAGIDISRGGSYLTQEDPPTAECGYQHATPGS